MGCGAGIISEALARLGAEVTAIDACEDNIEAAKRHQEAETDGLPSLSYLCTSVEDLAAAEKDKFDAVVASEVIEHVDIQEMFVSLCSR